MLTVRARKQEKGQASLEFLVVTVVVFFFLLFYLSLAMALVLAQYVDYATFMAARTYKAAFTDIANQKQYSQIVFDSYTKKLPSTLVTFSPLNFIEARGNDLTAGVQSNYSLQLFYLPPVFAVSGAEGAQLSRLNLTSEAYLGREPTMNDSIAFFKQMVQDQKLKIDPDSSLMFQMEDNGF